MSQQTQEFLVFELNGMNFSIPLSTVEEVVPSNVITAIPNSPEFLLGLSAVRGKVLGVIDAARRYGMKPGTRGYFMVCLVRGNLTAVTIDRPVLAGFMSFRMLDKAEIASLPLDGTFNKKFITGAFELLEKVDDSGATRPTGTFCVQVDPDLFVSAEMASKIGEVA
ncbi:MAG TPA: chemotaxis protein CheW [Bdellovibrionota bacterium]|jgi:chemotaxis signal transduction protein